MSRSLLALLLVATLVVATTSTVAGAAPAQDGSTAPAEKGDPPGLAGAGVDAPAACTDDALEENDELGNASSLDLDTPTTGQICAGDPDWFAVTVPLGTTLTVLLDFDDEVGDLDLELTDAVGNQLDSSAGTTDQEKVELNVTTAQTLYLHVYGYEGSEGPYTLTATLDCIDDDGEDDDERATARPLSISDFESGRICAGDRDMFAVDLLAGDQVTIDLTFPDVVGDLDLALEDSTGTEVASAQSVTDDEQITYDVTVAGTYYVRVVGWAGAEAAYTLRITTDRPCTDDDREDDDDGPSATPLVLGESVTGTSCPGDPDWFAFAHEDGDHVVATVTYDSTTFDGAYAGFFGAGGGSYGDTTTVDSISEDERTETIHWTATDTATSFVQVVPLSLSTGYELTVTITPPCTPDVDEDNDTVETATPLGDNASIDRSLCPLDFDIYRLELRAGAPFTATASHGAVDDEIQMGLYSAEVFEIRAVATSTDPQQLEMSYTPAADETVLLAVSAARGLPTTYTLTTAAPTAPSAPTGLDAVPGNGQVLVSWAAPDDDGGSPVTGYAVTAAPGGATCSTGGAGTGCTVAGLTNGTSYTFDVVATNVVGDGPVAAVGPVTPVAVPGEPRNVVVEPGSMELTVSWDEPVTDGGSPVTGYTAMATPPVDEGTGPGPDAPTAVVDREDCTTDGATTSCTIEHLANGVAYDVEVVATNAVGDGPASEPVSATPMSQVCGEVAAGPFPDLSPTSPFCANVEWLVSAGITTGYPDGTFQPGRGVLRQEMAAFLFRFANPGDPAPTCTEDPFPDVVASSPFCGYIAWLVDEGITSGNADGTFGPGGNVTRGAMAAFMYRLANPGSAAPTCLEDPFPDVTSTNPFCGYVQWLVGTGVTTGYPDGTFKPATIVQRDVMAAFLNRLATHLDDQGQV